METCIRLRSTSTRKSIDVARAWSLELLFASVLPGSAVTSGRRCSTIQSVRVKTGLQYQASAHRFLIGTHDGVPIQLVPDSDGSKMMLPGSALVR